MKPGYVSIGWPCSDRYEKVLERQNAVLEVNDHTDPGQWPHHKLFYKIIRRYYTGLLLQPLPQLTAKSISIAALLLPTVGWSLVFSRSCSGRINKSHTIIRIQSQQLLQRHVVTCALVQIILSGSEVWLDLQLRLQLILRVAVTQSKTCCRQPSTEVAWLNNLWTTLTHFSVQILCRPISIEWDYFLLTMLTCTNSTKEYTNNIWRRSLRRQIHVTKLSNFHWR